MRKPHRKHLKFLLAGALLILLTLFVLNTSIAGREVVGCPEDCATASERAPGPLRIVSLNMLHGIPFFIDLDQRVKLITAELKRLEADVVLLQEVPWTTKTGNVAEVLAGELGYNYLYLRANGSKLIFFEEGEAILCRFPLTDIVFTELRPRVNIFQHRVALGTTALTPWGEIRLFSTHLTHSDPAANAGQVADLQDFVEANTLGMGIVAGDFNAREDSPEIKSLSQAWTDTYRQAYPDDPGLTCCTDDLKAAPGAALQMRIDYIFLVQSSWKLVGAEHVFYSPFQVRDGWQWASDHTGLMVELEP